MDDVAPKAAGGRVGGGHRDRSLRLGEGKAVAGPWGRSLVVWALFESRRGFNQEPCLGVASGFSGIESIEVRFGGSIGLHKL